MAEFDAHGEFERRFVRPRAGRTLIVGSYVVQGKEDRRLRYPEAIGVDMRGGHGVDYIADMEDVDPFRLGRFWHVECMSVLEHCRRPWKVAETIEAVMDLGATLHVTVPFIWRIHAYPSDYWRMTIEALPVLFPRIKWAQRLYGGEKLWAEGKVRAMKTEWHPYLARTEIFGFGVRDA
jgi:hypothetical protein